MMHSEGIRVAYLVKMMSKSYQELLTIETFADRLRYLKIDGCSVGEETFGTSRFLNQLLYKDPEWLHTRNLVIIRDQGCNLGLIDYPIVGRIYVHHINPITKNDILNKDPKIFDLNNLISCSFDTHNAIHYGNIEQLIQACELVERKPYDTCPWRK